MNWHDNHFKYFRIIEMLWNTVSKFLTNLDPDWAQYDSYAELKRYTRWTLNTQFKLAQLLKWIENEYLIVFKQELERKLSDFHGREDTILYASCFDANAGVFEAILSPEDAVFSDELNHASIIDGIRLCKAQKNRYLHRDMDGESKLFVFFHWVINSMSNL